MIVYLNGQWLDRDQARISPEDRGFMFSDGVYEVVRYYFGRPLAMDLHIQRMKFGLGELRISLPTGVDMARIGDELMRRNSLQEAAVYWQVTRGAAPRSFTFPPAGTPPTIYAIAYPAIELTPAAPTPELRAITRPDIRWQRCEIKAISLLPNVLAAQEAQDAGCECAILVRDGDVTEATSRSILIVEDGVLATYPTDGTILDSITRRIAIDLAHRAGITVLEDSYRVERMYRAQEVIAVGSTTEVASVTHVDGRQVGSGGVGPIAKRLFEMYRDYIYEHCRGIAAAL